jgi:hypothetical protein
MPKLLKDATPEAIRSTVDRMIAETLAKTGMVVDPVTGEIKPSRQTGNKSQVILGSAKARGIPVRTRKAR